MKKSNIIMAGFSFKNGVMFYSNRWPRGYKAIARIDEDESITVEWTKASPDYTKLMSEKKEVICSIIMMIAGIAAIQMIHSYMDVLRAVTLFLSGTLSAFLISLMIGPKDILRFHAAEHMVINAYKDLKRVPSITAVRRYSMLANNCSSLPRTISLISSAVTFVCSFVLNFRESIIIFLVLMIGQIVMQKLGLLNFYELLVLRRPTDREIRVALEAARYWEENERRKS